MASNYDVSVYKKELPTGHPLFSMKSQGKKEKEEEVKRGEGDEGGWDYETPFPRIS